MRILKIVWGGCGILGWVNIAYETAKILAMSGHQYYAFATCFAVASVMLIIADGLEDDLRKGAQ